MKRSSKINSKTTREELAAIIVKEFESRGMSAVLVGGAVVSIYTKNKYRDGIGRKLTIASPASSEFPVPRCESNNDEASNRSTENFDASV